MCGCRGRCCLTLVRLETCAGVDMDMLLLDRIRTPMKTTKAVFGTLPIALGLLASQAFTCRTQGQLYILSTSASGTNNIVGEYTTSGETVNASLIQCSANETPLGPSGGGLAYDGNGHLFVVNAAGVGEYTTSGTPVNSSLRGLSKPPHLKRPFHNSLGHSELRWR